MSKKRKKKSRNPAAEAERRRRAQATKTPTSAEVVAEPVGTPANQTEDTFSHAEYQALLTASQKLQDQSVDLVTDFNRVLQAYTQLVTNSFKLSATMSEFDIENAKSVERLRSKLAFFIEDLPRNCEKAGIKMPALSGLDYSPNLNVQVLNSEDFSPQEALVIDEVVEPILIYEPKNSSVGTNSVGGLLKSGLVTLKRKES